MSEKSQPDNKKTKSMFMSKDFWKKAMAFFFARLSLLVMVGIYAVAGAFLFRLLEEHKEAKDCHEGRGVELANIVNLKSNLLTYIQYNISSVSTETNKDNETVANTKIESWLSDFRDQVFEIRSTYSYSGQDCTTSSKWSFPRSLLFVMTIFTTIGYGHIAPVTSEGQIVCICYATIGIPLFLMFLSRMSSVLGDMFRFLYSRVCCFFCYRRKMKKKEEKKKIAAAEESDSEQNNKVQVVDDDEEKGEDEEEKVTVPLTITMIVFTLYIIIGALIFSNFEDWPMVAAGYFCFITLSTIGFGDYVPGQKEDDQNATFKLITGCIYLLIGMAILAMCFDLMQEEIIAKFTWLGKKLGIVDKEEDEEETDEKDKEKKADESEEKKVSEDKIDLGGSPVPSYSGFVDKDDRETMSRMRSAYLQSVVQRQKKY
ncbi:T family of potassium channels 7-like [Brachionus plicatilis]|uniref:T family of potassium channels 7-like n=1 Tax=Brachionus plicatilis TaxID=10195 RepID=A0A3M7S5S7_BRAPC|nr:T family of potassium channels 7-like [Brachionus plicatilis]